MAMFSDRERIFFSVFAPLLFLMTSVAGRADDSSECDPDVCRTVKLNQPQLFVDDDLIENRYNEKFLSSRVPHVRHAAKRGPPIITPDPDKPWEKDGLGYLSVVYDAEAELFRLYYQVVVRPEQKGTPGYPNTTYCIAYAESRNGVEWTKPLFDLIPWGDIKRTNIILQGKNEAHAPHVQIRPPVQLGRVRNIGALPAGAFRGNRFLMYCSDPPHFLSTAEDGVRFKIRQQPVTPRRIDCHQSLVFDEERGEFVTFLRNKMIFGGRTGTLKKANHRMVTRLSSSELWTVWRRMPTTVILPDAGDAERFYAMPTFRYGGIYFGFLHHLQQKPMTVEVELGTSRDGFRWDRSPTRAKIIAVGEPPAWDHGMVYSADRVIENGDEWWLYYSGHNDYHDEGDGYGSVGLLRFRKEGFISVRADEEGGDSYLVTRPFRWPGGDLVVNADASGGHLAVRVTDFRREQIGEFSYDDCEVFRGDSVRHRMKCKTVDIRDLKGQLVRLEFRFVKADLYAFVAQERD